MIVTDHEHRTRPGTTIRRVMQAILAVFGLGCFGLATMADRAGGHTPIAQQAAGAGIESLTAAATATERASRIPNSSAPVGGSTSAGWIVNCPYSHTLADDPIVFPNMPGMSHSHDFLGSTDTNAASTDGSMRGAPTTCGLKTDTAGYWVPTLSNDGAVIHPVDKQPGLNGATSSQNIYYRNPIGLSVQPIPAGLRMVSGNSKATGVADNPHLGHDIWWGCSDNSISAKLVAPPASCPEGIITVHIHFPDCWNGISLDSPDHQSHVAWSSSGRCPATHPVHIAEVTIRLEWVVGPTTGAISLASGPTYTIHGDFWNTWDQAALDNLTATCVNAGKDCGKFR